MDNMLLDKKQTAEESILAYLKRVRAGRNRKDNNYFSDEEYRILLSALGREKEVCKKVDRDCGGEPRLLRIMESIERKVAKLQYSKLTSIDIDACVEYRHHNETEQSLKEFLGLSDAEYEAFLREGNEVLERKIQKE